MTRTPARLVRDRALYTAAARWYLSGAMNEAGEGAASEMNAHVHDRWRAPWVAAAALIVALLPGCKMAAMPWLMWGKEPTRTVEAEYPYLDGKRICIAVWADSNTLFEYPYVRIELSEHLRTALQDQIPRISFIPNRDVVDYQKSHPDWDREDPIAIGAHFQADRVLLVELTHYTTREPDSPHLLRGIVAANVRLYDVEAPKSEPLYRTTVEAVYPEQSPTAWGTSESAVRRAAMETFAIKVAHKFHDYREKVR